MFESTLQALSYLGNGEYWVAVLIAVGLAMFVGVMPGISSVIVMALAIPFILFNVEDPAIGIVMLAAITGLNNTLDSMAAILAGLPGGATQVTYLEGQQLARQGKAAHTLGAIYTVTALGGIIGALTLAAVIPIVKPFILSFSFAEIAVMALFGIGMVSTLSQGARVKGLAAGAFGMLLGSVGVDPLSGVERFSYGQIFLYDGLPLVATILGIFALPEMIDLSMARRSVAPPNTSISIRDTFAGVRYALRQWKVTIRQSLFGVFFGAIPGVGSGVVDWLAYALGISFTKDKSQFGKGSLDGVLFAESAQNSKEGGQAIPTLALGIPGGNSWALVIVAMLAYNIVPGPDMLGRYAHITTVLVITLALGNVIVGLIGLLASAQLVKLTLVPYPAIGSLIIPLALVAAFLNMQSWYAIPVALGGAIIGLAMKWHKWPRPPLIIGLILGPIFEVNIRTALNFEGAIGVLTRPVTIVMLVLFIVFIFFINRSVSRNQPDLAIAGASDVDSAPEYREDSSRVVAEHPLKKSFRNARYMGRAWRPSNIIAAAFVAAGAYGMWQSLTFSGKAAFLPFWLSLTLTMFASTQLLLELLKGKRSDAAIMDLGMRSSGIEGVWKAGMIVAGLFVGLVLVSITVGLQYGAIAYAAVGPAVLLAGRWRWIAAAVSGLLMAAFIVGTNQLMHTIWPAPIFGQWW